VTLFDILWRLAVVGALVFGNGFFVASEYALVSVRPTRLDQLAARGNRLAELVRRAREDPNQFISATQLGITVMSLLLGWVGEETFAEILMAPMQAILPAVMATAAAHTAASVVALVLLTFFHVTLGEQVPKMIALQRSEQAIMVGVRPVQLWGRLLRPFIALLYGATALVLQSLGLQSHSEEYAVHSAEELRLLLARSARAGVIQVEEREMLDRVFGFARLTAAEVMVPRTEVSAIPVQASLDEAIELALSKRYSRFPVFDGSLDNVVGVLLVKDLLAASQHRRPELDTRRLMRPPVFVPATLPAIDVLARMKASRAPLAVVLDEYGGTDGIVTLKDLVERVVGDVGDEYVNEIPQVRPQPDGTLLADGLTLVDDFNQQVGAGLESSGVDTLGGLVLARLGRLAEVGDALDLGEGYQARVERLDGRRIAELRIWPPASDPDRESEAVPRGDGGDGSVT